ncbi:unnamed protein product [Ceratitis capitata]|uniref:(Mediterranean fruit fly) hypothetical protein n=1 Tax=Ceratitis capitata TaxID=7213 RepID=A0A811UUU2_CERCA|nr:unnamed protein product [Ceratitis capitata]
MLKIQYTFAVHVCTFVCNSLFFILPKPSKEPPKANCYCTFPHPLTNRPLSVRFVGARLDGITPNEGQIRQLSIIPMAWSGIGRCSTTLSNVASAKQMNRGRSTCF